MSTSGRLVLCNMSVEAGATSGIVPATRRRSATCARRRASPTRSTRRPDADAVYERVVEIDASALVPQVACPHTVDNVKPVDAVPARRCTRS
jgi:homoaconitase/3-isopropylmalate dehydratase large subunit